MTQSPIVSKPQPRHQRLIYIFKRHRWELMALGMTLLIYLFIFSQMPTSVFWSPDEGAKFLQLRTLRWDGGMQYQIPYPGKRLDPAYTFYPHPLDRSHPYYDQSVLYPRLTVDGSARFNWPIWFPLISILFFSLFGVTGLYLIPLVSGWLTVVLSGWLVHRLLPAAAPLTIVTVGLATPIFFYSLLFWEHTLVVLIGLAALWSAMQMGRNKWWTLTLTGLFLGSAVALRLEMILYTLALLLANGIAWLVHYRPQFSFQLNFKPWNRLLIVGAIGLVLVILFSSLKPVQEGWLGQNEKDFIEQGLSRLNDPNLLRSLPYRLQEIWINTSFEGGPEVPALLGWLGLAGVVVCGLAMACQERARIWLLAGGGLLIGLGSAYALFSPQRYRAIHSLLLPAPHLVFALLFLIYARYERRFEVTLVAVTTMLYLILAPVVAIFGVRGGLEWGARYLLIAYPLATISAVVGLHHFYRTHPSKRNKRLLLGLAVLLFLIGAQYEVRGVREIQTTKKDLIAYQNILAATRQPVVTDLYWLPAALTTRFVEQEIYTLAQREDLYTWLNLVSDQVDSFLFVSFTPLEADFIQRAPIPLIPRGEQLVRGMTFAEFEVLQSGFGPGLAQKWRIPTDIYKGMSPLPFQEGVLIIDKPLTARDRDRFQPHQVRKKQAVWTRWKGYAKKGS